MHSKSGSDKVIGTGEPLINSSQAAPEMIRPDRPSVESEDSEEVALAKASTVVMDEDADTLDAPQPQVLDNRSNFYIQGVIQGGLVYIITNLLSQESQTLFQAQRVWTIGRNREAALPLRDRALSRRHAVILYVPQEGFYLVDLNSMNGSFVNGMRIRQRLRLKDGDRLRMGSLEFNFFTSNTARTINPIHPEVLSRFTTSRSRNDDFMDYASLEEPDVLFQSVQKGRMK